MEGGTRARKLTSTRLALLPKRLIQGEIVYVEKGCHYLAGSHPLDGDFLTLDLSAITFGGPVDEGPVLSSGRSGHGHRTGYEPALRWIAPQLRFSLSSAPHDIQCEPVHSNTFGKSCTINSINLVPYSFFTFPIPYPYRHQIIPALYQPSGIVKRALNAKVACRDR